MKNDFDKEELLRLLETVEHHKRLYPDTYIDMLLENGVTIRREATWEPAIELGDCIYRCTNCGKIIDHYCDEDDNFCAKCGFKMSHRNSEAEREKYKKFLEMSPDKQFEALTGVNLYFWQRIMIRYLTKWWDMVRRLNPHIYAYDLWESIYKGRY